MAKKFLTDAEIYGAPEILTDEAIRAPKTLTDADMKVSKDPSWYAKKATPFFKRMTEKPKKGITQLGPLGEPYTLSPESLQEGNIQTAVALQNFLPVIPQEAYKQEWEQEHPISMMAGKIGGYYALGGLTSKIAPGISASLQAPGGVGMLAKALPLAAKDKFGLGLALQTSKIAPYLARAIPRMASRAALWGGKELLDETVRVLAGKKPSVEGLVYEPAKEAAFGAGSGAVSGMARTFPRIAAQGGFRGLWVTGKALLDDGIIDKKDLTNIYLNAVIGMAVESINAKQISAAYKARELASKDYSWARKRIMRRHPEYTPKDIDNTIGMMRAMGKGYGRAVESAIHRSLKDVKLDKGRIDRVITVGGKQYEIPQDVIKVTGVPTTLEHVEQAKKIAERISPRVDSALLKAAVLDKFLNNINSGQTAEEAMKAATSMSVADLVGQLRVGGISANILRPFEPPTEGEAEVVARPAMPVDIAFISPNEQQNYDVVSETMDDKLTMDEGKEKVLEFKALGSFDGLGIKVEGETLSWSKIPQLLRRVITRHVQSQGEEGLQQFIDKMVEEDAIISEGGVGEDASANTNAFWLKRIKWGKNPSTNIESIITDMVQAKPPISPATIYVMSSNPGDAEKVANEIKNQYIKKVHPEKPPEVLSDAEVKAPVVTPLDKFVKEYIPEEDAQDEHLEEFFKERKEEKKTEADIEKIKEKSTVTPVDITKRTPRYMWSPKSGEGFWEKESGVPKLSPEERASISPEEQVRRDVIEAQQKAEIIANKLQKIINERLTLDEAPAFLKGTATNDASKRKQVDMEDEETGEIKPKETSEDVAEQERWQEGMREQQSLGRDIVDYMAAAKETVRLLTQRIENIKAGLKFATAAKIVAEKAQIAILEKQLQESNDWIASIAVDNDMYSIVDGKVILKKMFLNLRNDVTIQDSVTGPVVTLHGAGVSDANGAVNSGAYHLTPMPDGRILIKDLGDRVVVFPTTLFNIIQQGGEFTEVANISAGGMASKGINTFNGKPTDDKKDLVPGMREYTLTFKTILKMTELFKWDADRLLDQLKNHTKGMIKLIQDPKIAPIALRQFEKEIHLNKYSFLMQNVLEDHLRQHVRKFVEKERKRGKLPITEKAVVDDIDSIMFVAQHANPEFGAVNSSRIFLTDQGMSLGFQPGAIPGHPDSEQVACITAYKQAIGEIPMPPTEYGLNEPKPGKINTFGRGDPALLQMMEQGTRPELLFFNMLPPELKRLLVYVKAEYENVHFQDMIDSGVMDRADIHALMIRGYSNRVFKFPDDQKKEAYYSTAYLGSTDLPHAKYRTYAEFVLASGMNIEGVDLMPIVDYGATMGEYVRDAIARTAQMQMIDAFKSISNEYMSTNGQPPLGIITYEKDVAAYLKLDPKLTKAQKAERVQKFLHQNRYSELKLEGLVEYFHGAFVTAWVRNDVKHLIKKVYNTSKTNSWIRNMIKLNGLAKRNIMMSPYQYTLQIGSSPAVWLLGGKGVWTRYIRPLATFEALWGPVLKRWRSSIKSAKEGYGWKYGFRQHLSDWDHITKVPIYNAKKLDAFIRAGLSVFNPSSIKSSMYGHDPLKGHPDRRTEIDDIFEFLSGKGGVDTQIFNHIIARLMYSFTEVIEAKLLKDGIDSERATELAVDFANRTSGMLDPAKWRSSADAAVMYQLLLFARDFTFSFMTQVTGAAYGLVPKKIPFTELPLRDILYSYKPGDLTGLAVLLHSDKTKAEKTAMTRYYQEHLMRIFFVKMIGLALFQYAFIKAYKETPEGAADDTVTEEHQWAWMNWKDPKKFGMIRTPWRDHMGRQLYIDPLLFREFNQMVGIMPFLGGNPGRWIKGKASWVVNAGYLLMNQMSWKKQPVTDQRGVISFTTRQGDVAKELVRMTKPTFLPDDPVSTPALNIPPAAIGGMMAAGLTFKKSQVPVGQGESFENNKRMLDAMGLKAYYDMKRKEAAGIPKSRGDIEALEKLVDLYDETEGKKGLSQEALDDYLWKKDAPGDYMENKNKRAIDLFMKGR